MKERIDENFINTFITACQYENCGSKKQLNINGFKIVVHCKEINKDGAIYDVQMVQMRNKNNSENICDVSSNDLPSEIRRAIKMTQKTV